MNIVRSRRKEYASFIDDKFLPYTPPRQYELENNILYNVNVCNNVKNAYISCNFLHYFSSSLSIL